MESKGGWRFVAQMKGLGRGSLFKIGNNSGDGGWIQMIATFHP